MVALRLVMTGLILAGLAHSAPAGEQGPSPAAVLERGWKARLEILKSRFEAFPAQAVQACREPEPIGRKALRNSFLELRLSYKGLEYLIEYYHPHNVPFLNGAVLVKADAANPSFNTVVYPEGLQVLEERIHSDSPCPPSPDLSILAGRLSRQVEEMIALSADIRFQDRQIFEAMREEVLRVMTLGIAGFDSPVARNSTREASAALAGVEEAMKKYLPHLPGKHRSLGNRISREFRLAIGYLDRAPDFESFDRLAFTRKHAIPMHESLLDLHLALGLETKEETEIFQAPVNYRAGSPFSKDFLNPWNYGPVPGGRGDDKMIALGKSLFFDPILSGNIQRACASCHKPELAFTDGKAKSLAFDGKGTVRRNSPTVLNAAFHASMFYDHRARFLEEQLEHVVSDEKEFRSNFNLILSRVGDNPGYRRLFQEAFPEERNPVQKFTLVKSIAAYVRSLATLDSPLDRYMRRETDDLPLPAKRGYNLFMGKAGCGTCHFPPHFNGTVPPTFVESESEVLGVPMGPGSMQSRLDPDLGRFVTNPSPVFRNAFKTPTLRNIELTAPYMHNGVFATLGEVLDFYNAGGGVGLGQTLTNQTLPQDSLGLTRTEMDDILSFLRALTDTVGTTSKPSLPAFPGNPELSSRPAGGAY